MLAALVLAAQAATMTPPADWQTLPPLPFETAPESWPQLRAFVADEVKAGRCTLTDDHLDLAVLIDPSGQVRRIVPRAIECPTVEQFVAGSVLRRARGNVVAPPVERWFHLSIDLTRP